jgi:choline kinase
VISVAGVVGYRADDIVPFLDEPYMHVDWSETNVLGSFLAARPLIESCASSSTSLLTCYSDVAVDPTFFTPLTLAQGDIVLLCDAGWRPHYEHRTAHPVTEAELIRTKGDRYVEGGKPQNEDSVIARSGEEFVEFTGAFLLAPRGCRTLLRVIDHMLTSIASDRQERDYLRTAYLTDLFNAAVHMGNEIVIAQTTTWWQEVDTSQDLERARNYLG